MHRLNYPEPFNNTPINKPGITDPEMLNLIERQMVQERSAQLKDSPLQGFTPDMKGMKAIHEYLFQDVYQTAGKIRGEEVNLFGKPFTPKLPTQWAKISMPDNKVEATFSAAPLNDPRLKSLAEGTKNLEGLLTQGAFGEQAVQKMLPVLSKMIGDINQIHPFWDGNGRAMKAFVEQTSRAFGLNVNTHKMSSKQWISATHQAKQGKSASLTKLLKSSATIMTKEELIADTYKAKEVGVDSENKEQEGLKTPDKQSILGRLFRRQSQRVAPKQLASAPITKPLAKGVKANTVQVTAEAVKVEKKLSATPEMDAVIKNARTVKAKVGDQSKEIETLQDSIITAVNKKVPLLGPKADPALIREMQGNNILKGEILAAQSSLDLVNRAEGLSKEINTEQAAKPQTLEDKLKSATQDIVNSAGSNRYTLNFADVLAATNPQFARGYYTTKRLTAYLVERMDVKTEVTEGQMREAAKDLKPVKLAQSKTEGAAKDLFKDPEAALKNISEYRVKNGLTTKEIANVVKDNPSKMGELKSFKKGIFSGVDEMAKGRAVAKMRGAIQSEGDSVDAAISKFKDSQKDLVEGLGKGVPAPTEDLNKLIDKVQVSKAELKVLPAGTDKARVYKESARVTQGLNGKTQLFGQTIPGVSDAGMKQLANVKQIATAIKAVAAPQEALIKGLSKGAGLGM